MMLKKNVKDHLDNKSENNHACVFLPDLIQGVTELLASVGASQWYHLLDPQVPTSIFLPHEARQCCAPGGPQNPLHLHRIRISS